MTSEHHYAWGAVMTLPRAEFIAAQSVAEAGYPTWLPQYKRRLRGVRVQNGRVIRSRRDTFEDAPLFRGYLFVQIPHGDGGYGIDKAHGVSRLLRTPHTMEEWGRPKIIRARFIIQIQEWVDRGLIEDGQGKIVPSGSGIDVRDDLPIGSRVRTPSGVIGTLSKLDEKGRADLMADILGDQRVIRNVDAETLELISA